MAATLAFVFGLLFGSFASVPIHRWPRGGSVTEPMRSACPSCGAPIQARDNVPVASWLLLRGRCRSCGEPIAPRYPAIELTTATLFGAVTAVHGVTWILPALLVLTWSLVVATAIDLEFRIIPNRLTYRLAPILAVLLAVAATATGSWSDLRRAAIVGVALPAGMLLLSELFRLLRGKVGMGMGDVKLAVSLGLVTGYLGGWQVVILLYGAIISAVVVAFALIVSGRAKLASRIPFGPYLAIGAMTAILVGEPLGRALARYLGI